MQNATNQQKQSNMPGDGDRDGANRKAVHDKVQINKRTEAIIKADATHAKDIAGKWQKGQSTTNHTAVTAVLNCCTVHVQSSQTNSA